MFSRFGLGLAGCIPLFFSSLSYGESALRVACYDDNEGAKVFINDQLRGNCPIDLFVPGGDIKLKAVKNVDRDRARFFETSFYLPDDSAKSIEVLLSGPQITKAGEERQRNERLAKEKSRAQETLTRARDGDLEAMYQMVSYYREGYGVAKDSAKSIYWSNKYTETKQQIRAKTLLAEAENGNLSSMEELVSVYKEGKGVAKDLEAAKRWADSVIEAWEAKAQSGDIEAMQKLSEIYQDGHLVEKNLALAEDWSGKASKLESEIAEYERQQNVQERLDDIEFFHMSIESTKNLIEEPYMVFTWSVVTPTALVFDLTSMPVSSTELYQLKQELGARPAQWDNPDSMVAKAYALKKQKEAEDAERAQAGVVEASQ